LSTIGTTTPINTCDVLIAGGGLAGLSLALQLRMQHPELSVVVVEKNEFPLPEAAHKVGESSVEVGAHYFGEVLGLRDLLLETQVVKFGLRCFFGDGNLALDKRVELGPSRYFGVPTYQIDRGIFENSLREKVLALDGAVLDMTSLRSLEQTGSPLREQGVARWNSVVDHPETGESSWKSNWFIDATGRAGFLRRHFNLSQTTGHSSLNSAWWRVDAEIDISHWSDASDWEQGYAGDRNRSLSTNHLMGEGYWVWIIPLPNKRTSVGIVADDRFVPFDRISSYSKALQWLKQNQGYCFDRIADLPVMDFKVMKRYAHDCGQCFSADGWAVTGDAGPFSDPFYSPGSDFIGFANSFITRMITSNGSDREIKRQTRLFESLYRRLFMRVLDTYQDSYAIWGNAEVMSAKVIWDFAIYWSLPAFFFTQDRLASEALWIAFGSRMSQIEALSLRMQEHFRKTGAQEKSSLDACSIDLTAVPFLCYLNETLCAPFSESQFLSEIRLRATMLEQFAAILLDQGWQGAMEFRCAEFSCRPGAGEVVAQEREYQQAMMG
jgi:flavin-dependent dehydrogenase